jgi:hypothetical protein
VRGISLFSNDILDFKLSVLCGDNYLVGWLVGWLVGCLVGWLVGNLLLLE